MAVQFQGDSLIDDNGNERFISYEELIRECLERTEKVLSIRNIIFESVRVLVGEKVVGTTYRKSTLFNRLESDILADNKYIENRKRASEEREKYKDKKHEEYYISSRAQYFVKRNQLAEMRRRQY